MDRTMRQVRTARSPFTTREDGKDLHIEGYFAVFNSDYNIYEGLSESVDPEAFRNTLGGDIRALTDHDTRLVLGRTTAGTLTLRTDSHGLYGDITINPNDGDAMNLYARVQRGDVDQCSFGFNILDEESEVRADGSVHWTIKEVELFEVSVCTFPAYEETNVVARKNDLKEIQKRAHEAWALRMKNRLKKGKEE